MKLLNILGANEDPYRVLNEYILGYVHPKMDIRDISFYTYIDYLKNAT